MMMEELILQKLDSINECLGGMDKRLDGMDERFNGIDKCLDGIDKRLDGMDKRFDRIEKRLEEIDVIKEELKIIKVDLIENNIIPRLSEIEGCYISTYRRYLNGSELLDGMQSDINVMKQVITKHSEQLQKIS